MGHPSIGQAPATTTIPRRHRWTARAAAALSAVGLVAAALAVAQPASAGQPAPAAVAWAASHGNGFASGTAETSYSFFFKTVTVVGEIGNSAAGECYLVQLVAHHDLAPAFHDVEDQCGYGTTAFQTGASGSIATSSFHMRVCRIAGYPLKIVSCGPLVRVG